MSHQTISEESVGEEGIRVWCLLGRKAGDNTQVLALANALGWLCEEKRVVARPWELLVHLGPAATLAGIDRGRSSPLVPPWPDLVISAGRRNEPVAQWIRRQSRGRSRLIHMGRPWAPLSAWDLIVTTPQYFLPEADNILHNSLPLHNLRPGDLLADGKRLAPRLSTLPRPWIAVLVGGDSGRFVLTRAKGEALGALADQLATRTAGSLLVSDSPRTPGPAGDALCARLTAPHFTYRWAAGGENPYRGILALADAFLVTGESMSMLGEAVATARPVFVFDTGDGGDSWWKLAHNYRYKPLSHRLAMALGPRRMRRDVGRIQSALVADGRAHWLDSAGLDAAARTIDRTMGSPAPAAVPVSDLDRAAEAVRRLMPTR